MRKVLDVESCKGAGRYSKAAAVLPTVDTNTRWLGTGGGGEGGRGGRERPVQETEIWSSDHLPDVCAFL